MFRNRAPVMICGDRTLIRLPTLRIGEVFDVVAYRKHKLVGHQSLIHQIQCQGICHFLHRQPGGLEGIRVLQHLTGADAV